MSSVHAHLQARLPAVSAEQRCFSKGKAFIPALSIFSTVELHFYIPAKLFCCSKRANIPSNNVGHSLYKSLLRTNTWKGHPAVFPCSVQPVQVWTVYNVLAQRSCLACVCGRGDLGRVGGAAFVLQNKQKTALVTTKEKTKCIKKSIRCSIRAILHGSSESLTV